MHKKEILRRMPLLTAKPAAWACAGTQHPLVKAELLFCHESAWLSQSIAGRPVQSIGTRWRRESHASRLKGLRDQSALNHAKPARRIPLFEPRAHKSGYKGGHLRLV